MTASAPDPFAVWLPLARAHKTILTAVEAALKQAGLPGLDWYDLLWELECAGDAGLRPYELQEKLLLPQYGVSRLAERLAKAGYLTRQDCSGDGRGQVLLLTAEGAETRAQMWAVYSDTMQQAVTPHFSPGEARRLSELLGKLLRPASADKI
ncbi:MULTISPECIES: MarR family winged helix-turn-helix transcriptional regulator [unclassified Leisingera]|uniref:MarR family winged helix-turn-helix transcriptional regulator n=1 Tax=unclassified Leisingera TaxID=2614906 RepID=UPI00057C8392|nr:MULTISPECIES: MarR family winged helix-turn-helix transcriptional regulator [unclassified Leisingera]KIC17938.1 MarR family transcriptional regulator [Leisingera sp. ANG-DT]KIC27570.1 MarR family transcriptional regulator [Leisingera sp. ANG-M6]